MSDDNNVMTDTNSGHIAYEALLNLAGQARQHAKGLPAQLDITPHWSGIGFQLLGRHFVAPMGEVVEMLEVPPYTHLPGVHEWVRGVANVRGRLLPLCDLALFFGEKLTASRKRQRVLVLEQGDLYTGLLVDQVMGMQHFPVDCFNGQPVLDKPVLAPYIEGAYEHNNVSWLVFKPLQLVQDAGFMNAAAS